MESPVGAEELAGEEEFAVDIETLKGNFKVRFG